MSQQTSTTWSASNMRRKETTPKIADPGVYSRLKLTSVERDDNKFKYLFTNSDETAYTDVAVFFKANPSYTKSVEDQEKAIVGTLVDIADAVGNPMEISSMPPAASFMALVESLNRYIESKVNIGLVNMKIILDKDLEYTQPANFGFIEKWVEGKTPTLRFTSWEVDNKRTVRTKPRTYNGAAKNDDTGMPGMSSSSTSFTNEELKGTVLVDGQELPF